MDLLKFGRQKQFQRGYTLIELIVATTVLGLGITSSLFLINQSVRNAGIVKNKFVATYLASEGVEIVRNIRDTNWRDGKVKEDGGVDDWRDGLTLGGVSCGAAANCGVDFDTTGLQTAVGTVPLRFNAGQYQYETGSDTVFTRKIIVEDLKADFSLKIISQVVWLDRGVPKQMSIEEHLYNWK